jgi:hypothetical protein
MEKVLIFIIYIFLIITINADDNLTDSQFDSNNENTTIPNVIWYDPKNYSYNDINNLLPIPSNINYNSNDTCVTLGDLVDYNYTDFFDNLSSWNKVNADNYCYGMLRYNISREDFFDIINKNNRKFF